MDGERKGSKGEEHINLVRRQEGKMSSGQERKNMYNGEHINKV